MGETYRKELVRRIVKNMLDIQILRMVQAQPLWGYKIKKNVETDFHVKIRHGALYPLLNSLERKGFLTSEKEHTTGRARKVYSITPEGREYLETYYSIIKSQIDSGQTK
jgi:PadR family transcriptional regulator PadR